MILLPPVGQTNLFFDPSVANKIMCNTEKTLILLVWLLPSLCSVIKLHTCKINFFFSSCTIRGVSEKYPTCVHISALVLFFVIRTVASLEVVPIWLNHTFPAVAFLWAPFSILGTSKSRRELCRDCTEASEAVQSCVLPKIAAQGSMNALARYRSEEASHRLTRNAVVSTSRHHAIFSELQRNILYVPPARKLVFSLRLRVAKCCVLRYRGMKYKNWIAHVPIAIQRSTIFFLFFFFFVQR